MPQKETQVELYNRQIDKLKRRRKGFKVGGTILTIFGALALIGGIIMYVLAIIDLVTKYDSEEASFYISQSLFVFFGVMIFVLGILLLIGGIALLVIQGVLFRRKIYNREVAIMKINDEEVVKN